MKVIQVNSFLSTNLISDFNQVATIEIEDKPFSEGAFGEVYFCISINSKKTTTPQIIKILKGNLSGSADLNYITIQKLQKKLSKKNDELLQKQSKTLLEEYPAFLAIPQFSFIGTFNGLQVKGFSSNNLKSLGFVEFREVLENDQLLDNYQGLALEKKMMIAYRFVSAFKILKECSFIHADMKPEALFVNTQTDTSAIIDYDSGVVTDNIGDEATTWGAHNDWVAPEIWKQLGQVSNKQRTIHVNLFTDTWSVAIGIHYFFATCHPLFYLTELSPRVIEEYFLNHKNKWPDINKNAPYFNQQYSQIYDKYVNFLNTQVPSEIKDRLSNTINRGYLDPSLRTSYDNWKLALEKTQKPAEILFFEPDTRVAMDGVSVRLKWNTDKAHTLLIDNGIGDVTGLNEIKVYPKTHSTYRLTAIGYYGNDEASADIKIFPTPVIESLKIPTPDFETRLNLNPISIQSPNINVSINFETNKLSQTPTSFIILNDDIQNAKPLFKKEETLWNISEIFHKVKKSMS